MSHWVYLQYDDGRTCRVPPHREGATYPLGGEGEDEAELSVTYNYEAHYRRVLHPDGLRWLHGRHARDCIEALERAVRELGTTPSENYWDPTEGNAGYALSILLSWARLHPDARFHVG